MKRFLLIVSLLFASFYQEYAVAAPEDDEEMSDEDSDVSQNDEENDSSESDDSYNDEEEFDEDQKQRHVDSIVDNLVGIDGNNVSRARGNAANKLMSENEQLKNEIKKLKKEIAKGGKSVKVASRGNSEDDDYEESPRQKSKKRSSSQKVSKGNAKKGRWKRLKQYPKPASSSRIGSARGSSGSFFTVKDLDSIKNIRKYVPSYSKSSSNLNVTATQKYPIHSYVVKSFATGEKIPFENYSSSSAVKQDYFSKKDCGEKCR